MCKKTVQQRERWISGNNQSAHTHRSQIQRVLDFIGVKYAIKNTMQPKKMISHGLATKQCSCARSVMCIFVSEKAVNVGQNSTLTWIPKMWRFLIHLFVQLKFFDIVLAYILYSSNIYLPPRSLRYLPLFVLHPTKTDYPTLALWLPDIILWILMIISLSSLWQTTAWLQIQIWT